MRVPFVQDNLHARFGQLDVALALRDQRVLNEGLKAPRSTRRVLRNNLTLRFPAVPLKTKGATPESEAQSTSVTMSDDDADTPWALANNPPGLQRSVCSELFRATQRTTDSLASALCLATGDSVTGLVDPVEDSKTNTIDSELNHMSEESSQENGGATLESSTCPMVTETQNTETSAAPEEPTQSPPPAPAIPPTLKEILALDLTIEQITRYQPKPKSMYTFLCALEFRRDEYPWHFRNVHNEIHSGLNGWLEHRCPLAHYGCTFSLRRLYPTCQGSAVVYNTTLESFGVRPYIPPSHLNCSTNNYAATKICQSNTLVSCTNSENLESPREMTPEIFTSRDYDSIVKVKGNIDLINKVNGVCHTTQKCNGHQVNQDPVILNGQNGEKMEQNSLEIVNGQTELENDPNDLEDSTCNGEQEEVDNLSVMPYEVLQHIVRFLDGFSLSNLSLTSRKMRDVCCSLLEEKGIVTMEWERRRVDGRSQWSIAYKVNLAVMHITVLLCSSGCNNVNVVTEMALQHSI